MTVNPARQSKRLSVVETNRKMLREAYKMAAKCSDDRSTNNGAILVSVKGEVIGMGANRLPPLVKKSPERLERPRKYRFMEHAERDAIFVAALSGREIEGSTMYCPWAACTDCARAIIGAGVYRLVTHKQTRERYSATHWDESIADADAMLSEAGVRVEVFDGEIGGVEILFNGEKWNP